jgi:hypothetical protein
MLIDLLPAELKPELEAIAKEIHTIYPLIGYDDHRWQMMMALQIWTVRELWKLREIEQERQEADQTDADYVEFGVD